MARVTTTIGGYPKPGYVPISDWFHQGHVPDHSDPTGRYLEELEGARNRATAKLRFLTSVARKLG